MSETVSAPPARKRKPTPVPDVGYGQFFEVNQRALEQWFHGMSEITQEIAQFTQQRLQQDGQAWMRLAECRSADELFACQQRFAENAVKQYFDEATKLSQLIAGMAGSWGFAAAPRSSAAE